MNEVFYRKLCEINGEHQVHTEESMKKHTTFRIGGNAEYYVNPLTIEALQKTLQACKAEGISYYILGNGSNILVSDDGYDGVVIQLFKNMSTITIEGIRIRTQAGTLLTKVSALAAKAGLTGLEFASGIPGTVGGALVMNAGAYGGEIKDVVVSATVMTGEGEVLVLNKEELELGYRTSVIASRGYIVLEAEFELAQGDPAVIEARMTELKEERIRKQPLEYPSAGSTFKRPEGFFAGKLIMDAGLRGYRVGDAQISEKHCGFVVNKGEATAQDVLQLVADVSREVQKQFGVPLELEIKTLGF